MSVVVLKDGGLGFVTSRQIARSARISSGRLSTKNNLPRDNSLLTASNIIWNHVSPTIHKTDNLENVYGNANNSYCHKRMIPTHCFDILRYLPVASMA